MIAKFTNLNKEIIKGKRANQLRVKGKQNSKTKPRNKRGHRM